MSRPGNRSRGCTGLRGMNERVNRFERSSLVDRGRRAREIARSIGSVETPDPAKGMIGILFTQRMMDSPVPPKVFTDFWTLAYGAMESWPSTLPSCVP